MYASRGVSGTLNKRMCGKIVNAHVFKMAGKITQYFFSFKSAKNLKTKNHPMVSSHRPKKFAATRQLLKCTMERKSRDRPTRTPNVVFVVASHYQSLQL